MQDGFIHSFELHTRSTNTVPCSRSIVKTQEKKENCGASQFSNLRLPKTKNQAGSHGMFGSESRSFIMIPRSYDVPSFANVYKPNCSKWRYLQPINLELRLLIDIDVHQKMIHKIPAKTWFISLRWAGKDRGGKVGDLSRISTAELKRSGGRTRAGWRKSIDGGRESGKVKKTQRFEKFEFNLFRHL